MGRSVGHEVEFAAVEQDADAIVLEVAEAAGVGLNELDSAVETFSGCVSDAMREVSEDVWQVPLQHLGDLLDRR